METRSSYHNEDAQEVREQLKELEINLDERENQLAEAEEKMEKLKRKKDNLLSDIYCGLIRCLISLPVPRESYESINRGESVKEYIKRLEAAIAPHLETSKRISPEEWADIDISKSKLIRLTAKINELSVLARAKEAEIGDLFEKIATVRGRLANILDGEDYVED